MVEELRNIHREVLPNGLIVLTEEMQHIRSVSIGIWVKTGSRHEAPEHNGISHFLEHMLFKGTRNRSAEEIARQVDSIGGNMDAFTAKETVCFTVKVLDDHLPIAIDILSDLVLNPVFNPASCESLRNKLAFAASRATRSGSRRITRSAPRAAPTLGGGNPAA